MTPFTIAADGDEYEKRWWPQWTAAHFPSYEAFWLVRIVALTYRVKHRPDVGFQTKAELDAAGYTDEDVAVAQLHYTLLRHLGRVFELLDDARAFTDRGYMANRPFRQNEFFEAFARLSGASDVADELLARRATPGKYGAWNERHGSNARDAWRQNHDDPLRPIRGYRNRLVHGRVVPELYLYAADPQGKPTGDVLFYPRVDKIRPYLDWRLVAGAVAAAERHRAPPPDFAEAAIIAAEAWEQVVAYVEEAWTTHLLPNV